MIIGDIFTDLHGNQYKILDYHVIGPDYPLFKDDRDAILTADIDNSEALIIRGNDQLIIYNKYYKIYFQYDIQLIQHFNHWDIRKGFTHEQNTKNTRTNGDASRVSQNRIPRTKRSKT